MKKKEAERLLNVFCGVIHNFIDFDKRLLEIAQENEVPYEEIWECWKEQRHSAGIRTEELPKRKKVSKKQIEKLFSNPAPSGGIEIER